MTTMLSRLFVTGSVALLLVAMTGCTDAPRPLSSQTAASVQDVIATGLHVKPDMDARDALQKLGEPESVETERVPNRHRPQQVDTLRTLHYPGLTITVYDATALDKSLVTDVKITSPAYEASDGLRVGMSRQGALERIQNATWVSGDTLVSNLDDKGPPVELIVTFDGDEVKALAWHFYID